jgi:hypothetical protein
MQLRSADEGATVFYKVSRGFFPLFWHPIKIAVVLVALAEWCWQKGIRVKIDISRLIIICSSITYG